MKIPKISLWEFLVGSFAFLCALAVYALVGWGIYLLSSLIAATAFPGGGWLYLITNFVMWICIVVVFCYCFWRYVAESRLGGST